MSANTAGSSSGAPSADIIPPLATAGGEITQQDTETEVTGDGTTNEEIQPQVTKVKERFFVVKSLTVEDLDLSVRNGIWATQAHNEAALNEAYGVCHFFRPANDAANRSEDCRNCVSDIFRQ